MRISRLIVLRIQRYKSTHAVTFPHSLQIFIERGRAIEDLTLLDLRTESGITSHEYHNQHRKFP